MAGDFSRAIRYHELRTGYGQKAMRRVLWGVPYKTYKRWRDGVYEPSAWIQRCVVETLEGLPDHPEVSSYEATRKLGRPK